MKKYIINKGSDSVNMNINELDAKEIFSDWAYNMDNAVTVYESENKNEALEELAKYNCDATITKTNTGYEWFVEIVELLAVELDEYGDIESEEVIERARFARESYEYRG